MLAFLGAIVSIVTAVTLIGAILTIVIGEKTVANVMYVSQLIILIFIIVAFYCIVDRLVIRRIQELNEAMEKVADGNYETIVPIQGKDELSGLAGGFNKMTAELRANAFLSKDFVRYVSHEFKTPLSVIRNYAEITQDESTESEIAKNMDVIISETDRLAGLSKGLGGQLILKAKLI